MAGDNLIVANLSAQAPAGNSLLVGATLHLEVGQMQDTITGIRIPFGDIGAKRVPLPVQGTISMIRSIDGHGSEVRGGSGLIINAGQRELNVTGHVINSQTSENRLVAVANKVSRVSSNRSVGPKYRYVSMIGSQAAGRLCDAISESPRRTRAAELFVFVVRNLLSQFPQASPPVVPATQV
jgi:hypothetical protein